MIDFYRFNICLEKISIYEEVDKLSIELRNIFYYEYNIIIEQNTYRKSRIFSSI